MTPLAFLAFSLALNAQTTDPRCPPNLWLHEPSGTCMSPEMQDRVNCLSLVMKSSAVLETVNRRVQENTDQTKVGGSISLIFREGSFNRVAEEAQKVAEEKHVRYSQNDLNICVIPRRSPPGHVTGGNDRPPERCARVQITAPDGAPEMAQAGRYPVVAPFEVRWLPRECVATVELVSQSGGASGVRAALPGTGPLQIRVVSQMPDGRNTKVLDQQWVNVTPPEPPPPPPPRPAEARISTASGNVKARLVGKEGEFQLKSEGSTPVQPGEYMLVWSNSSQRIPVTMKPGLEFLAHQEALPPPPPFIWLLPPTARNANLSELNGARLTKPQRLEPSGTDGQLKLTLLDDQQDVAGVQVGAAADGGVELKVEPAARKPSYLAAWVGGGGAAIAGAVWLLWLRPAANDAQDAYDQLMTGGFAASRDRVTTTSTRANVALGVALTSLVMGGALQTWELIRSAR